MSDPLDERLLWLALRLERGDEIRGDDAARTVRDAMDKLSDLRDLEGFNTCLDEPNRPLPARQIPPTPDQA